MMSGLGFIRCKQKAALFYPFLVCLNPFCNSVGKFIPIAWGKTQAGSLTLSVLIIKCLWVLQFSR